MAELPLPPLNPSLQATDHTEMMRKLGPTKRKRMLAKRAGLSGSGTKRKDAPTSSSVGTDASVCPSERPSAPRTGQGSSNPRADTTVTYRAIFPCRPCRGRYGRPATCTGSRPRNSGGGERSAMRPHGLAHPPDSCVSLLLFICFPHLTVFLC